MINDKRGLKKMKGIILAGGTATRLFPLTATTSKQLLPVYDRQMIFYPLNVLIKAGIKEILIIVSPEHSGQFLNLLGSFFENYGIYIDFKVQKIPRGLAEAFIIGEKFIGKSNVTMILGDNIFEDDFSKEIKSFRSGGHIFAKKVPDPERYGVVKFNKNNLATKIEEKPIKWISDYAIPGLYIYDNQVIEAAKKVKPSKRGEIEITALHNYYLKRNELAVSTISGEWLDAGTFDSLLEAGNVVKEKKLYEKFHPILDEIINNLNTQLKEITKKKLK
jgi:glucose-1-phosphate thymidylyltransferase